MSREFTLDGDMVFPDKLETILLEMTATSSLNFENERKKALELCENDFSILWEFDIGFGKHPYLDEQDLLSIQLGLRHFTETLFPQFEKRSCGVILYRGQGAFADRKLVLEYFLNLLAELPEELAVFLAFDDFQEENLFKWLGSTGSEHFHILVNNSLPYASTMYSEAILLPGIDCGWENLPKFNAKIIPEHMLTQQWEGIETLHVVEKGLSHQGRRKVQGFVAAGGFLKIVELL